MRAKTKIQLIEKEITKKCSLVRITEELDQNYKKLKGVAVLHTIGAHHHFTSFNIDSVEVFPKNFEVAFLQTNAHVAPKDRFFPLEQVADGKKIEIEFQDVDKNANPVYTVENSVSKVATNYTDLTEAPNVVSSQTQYLVNKNDVVTYPYTLKIYLLLSNE